MNGRVVGYERTSYHLILLGGKMLIITCYGYGNMLWVVILIEVMHML